MSHILVPKFLARATRWFKSAPRTEKECDAYTDGLFDGEISNAEMDAVLKLMKDLQSTKQRG
jgi:hypothetical protein